MKMDTELLIEAVYKRPQIWNQNDGNYNNRFIADKNWQDVADELKEKKEVVKKKWKHLRDQFRAELKKKPADQSDDADGEVEIISWPFFNLLLFLKDQIKKRQAYSLTRIKQRRRSSSNISLQLSDEDEQKCTVNMKQFENIKQQESDEDSTTDNLPHKKPMVKIKTARDQKEESETIKLKRRKLELLEKQYITSKMPRDEDESFFDSLIPHVRRLLPLEKLNFRMQTQAVLIDLLHKNIQSTSNMLPSMSLPNIFTTSLTPPPSEPSVSAGMTHSFPQLSQTPSKMPISLSGDSIIQSEDGGQNSVLFIQELF